MIKLIALDLDGVTCDAVGLHAKAFINSVFEITGVLINRKYHDDELNGIPTKKKLLKLADLKIISHKDVNEIAWLKQEYTIKAINAYLKKDQIKIDMVQELKYGGFNLACVTNSIRQTTELMLTNIGIIDYLDLIVTNEDVKQPKPNSECYIKAMRFFEVLPSETIIVEDSVPGIKAAKDSGAFVMEVDGPNDVNYKSISDFIEKVS